jgi:hypothetical protein
MLACQTAAWACMQWGGFDAIGWQSMHAEADVDALLHASYCSCVNQHATGRTCWYHHQMADSLLVLEEGALQRCMQP